MRTFSNRLWFGSRGGLRCIGCWHSLQQSRVVGGGTSSSWWRAEDGARRHLLAYSRFFYYAHFSVSLCLSSNFDDFKLGSKRVGDCWLSSRLDACPCQLGSRKVRRHFSTELSQWQWHLDVTKMTCNNCEPEQCTTFHVGISKIHGYGSDSGSCKINWLAFETNETTNTNYTVSSPEMNWTVFPEPYK